MVAINVRTADRDGAGRDRWRAANKSCDGGLRHTVDAFARAGSADGSISTDKDDPAAVFPFLGGCLDIDEVQNKIRKLFS